MRIFRFKKKKPALVDNIKNVVEPDEIGQKVMSTGLFDPEWYVFRYPDVANFPGGPIAHFVTHGLREVREPSPRVSLQNFQRRYPDASQSGNPVLFRAVDMPATKDRDAAWLPDDDLSLEYLLRQSGLFDEAWYRRRYDDIGEDAPDPIQHFIRHGIRELRDPGPGFESDFYQETQPDFETRSLSPIEDFLRYGQPRGFAAKGLPKYARWLASFDTLSDADVARIRQDAGPDPRLVTLVAVLDDAACARFDELLARWAGQVGVRCAVRAIRGAAIPDEAWALCRALAAARGDVAFPEDALSGLSPGAILLLCGGASLLRPHAGYVLAETLARSGADAAYADHDHIDASGLQSRPVFKPKMSPEFMRRLPYAGSVVAVTWREAERGRLAATLAAAASGDPDKAWAGYLLGLPSARIARAPFLLFQRPSDLPNDDKAVLEPTPVLMVQTSNDMRRAAPGPRPPDPDRPTITIVIPTRDRGDLLRTCVDSILASTDYPLDRVQILIVDNGSTEAATLSYLEGLTASPNISIVPSPGPFNFARVCNDGAARATGRILVFINNDMTVRQPDWLSTLGHFADQPDVAIVGARLLYPHGHVQHGGVVLGIQGVGAHRLVGMPEERARAIDVTREMVAVTGACLAVRRDVFTELGGFDPILKVAFNDVKLCAAAAAAGYRNIYVAEPLLHHLESVSRGYDDTRTKLHRNLREAIYVRERYQKLFRNDPSYSPNLSLQSVGGFAKPPRVVRPWRRPAPGQRRALLLSRVHGVGYGVAMVLERQADFLRERGWDIIIGGPRRDGDLPYEGHRRADLWNAESAASLAVTEGVDCVIAHTPPFFSVARYLGERPLLYFVDHGEPPPRQFPNWREREDIDWEKRFCAPLARRVFVISEAVRRNQDRRDAIVIRNGNDHLATWSLAWAARREALRAKLGFEGRIVILNVCRFGVGERYYKGVGRYGEVASDTPFRHPDLAGRVLFVLAGRGDADDVAEVEAMDVRTFANVSDAEMADLYAASDLYMSLSEWEGYNLGIGQARAMGLHVIASDIDAHREFGVETGGTVPEISDRLARYVALHREAADERRPSIDRWDTTLARVADTIEADCAEPSDTTWA